MAPSSGSRDRVARSSRPLSELSFWRRWSQSTTSLSLTETLLLSALQPDVHCKGPDYEAPEKVPEYGVVRSYGGRTALVGDPKDHATSDLISKVRALDP